MTAMFEIEMKGNLPISLYTRHPTTRELTDADSDPTYEILDVDTEALVDSGTLSATLFDPGNYHAIHGITVGNGFINNKTYRVNVTAIVDGVTDSTVYCLFRTILAAETEGARVAELTEMERGSLSADITEAVLTAFEANYGAEMANLDASVQDVLNAVLENSSLSADEITDIADGVLNRVVTGAAAGGPTTLAMFIRLISAFVSGNVVTTTLESPDPDEGAFMASYYDTKSDQTNDTLRLQVVMTGPRDWKIRFFDATTPASGD